MRPPRRGHLQRRFQGRHGAAAVDDDLGAAAGHARAPTRGDLARLALGRRATRSPRPRPGRAGRGGARRRARSSPSARRDQRGAGADRAVAEHDQALARAGAAAVERVQADGERLEQRADLVAHRVGQRHRAVGGEADQRREGAVGGEADRAARGGRGCSAPETQASHSLAAPAGVGGDAVARREASTPSPTAVITRGELVPERDRRLLAGERVGRPGRIAKGRARTRRRRSRRCRVKPTSASTIPGPSGSSSSTSSSRTSPRRASARPAPARI